MKTREMILLALFSGALAFSAGASSVTDALFGPIREREARVESLQRRIEQQKIDDARLQAADGKLKTWQKQSLPPDPSIASTLYQNWLIDLTNQTQMHEAVVTPNRVVPEGETYSRIPFTIKARTKLGPFCDFLQEFYATSLLHKITRISIETTQHTLDPRLDITVQLEALALNAASPRAVLLDEAIDPPIPPLLQLRTKSDYQRIIQRNLFVRGYNGPPAPVIIPSAKSTRPTDRTQAKFDAAAHVYLVASFRRDDQREAWMYDRTRNEQTVLFEGQPFNIADIRGIVLVIGNDFILVEIAGKTHRLELGKNLRQLTDV